MAGQMAVNVLVGATLAGSFGSTIGSAVGRIGSLAAAGGMIGRSVSGAMDFEHTLTRTAITADMSDAAAQRLRETLRGLSLAGGTNQSVLDLEKGFNALVSAGMSAERAGDSLRAIGRTATATGADITDLSKTAYVLAETLGVAPGALSRELDSLAFAGKAGAFELADMAKYFPMLGAGAKSLRLQGSEAVNTLAAALQIAKRGAGDPSEAANNMANFMKAITSPLVLKNAKKAGIDIKKIINTAIRDGENPMDAVLEAVRKKTEGDPFKIGKIFQDAQVQNFLKPMLADFEDYKKLKAEIAAQSLGTVDADYARMLQTAKEQATGLGNALEKAGDSLGRVFMADASGLIGQLTGLVTAADAFIGANPELVRMAALAGGSVAAFRLMGAASSRTGRMIAGMGRMGGMALTNLRADFRSSLAESNRLAASQSTLAARFRAAGGASGILRGGLASVRGGAVSARAGIVGLGTGIAGIPGRFRAAGGAAGAFRGAVTGLRVGLVGLRVGVRALGTAMKGLFMSNPLGWLMGAVELGALLYDSFKPFRDMIDEVWGGLQKVGGAISDLLSFGDDEEEGQAQTPAASPEEEKKRAERERIKAEVEAISMLSPAVSLDRLTAAARRDITPGAGAEQAMQNAVSPEDDAAVRAEEKALAAESAASPASPREQTFKHQIELTINAPAGFTAEARPAGGGNAGITVKTGRIMGGPN